MELEQKLAEHLHSWGRVVHLPPLPGVGVLPSARTVVPVSNTSHDCGSSLSKMSQGVEVCRLPADCPHPTRCPTLGCLFRDLLGNQKGCLSSSGPGNQESAKRSSVFSHPYLFPTPLSSFAWLEAKLSSKKER